MVIKLSSPVGLLKPTGCKLLEHAGRANAFASDLRSWESENHGVSTACICAGASYS